MDAIETLLSRVSVPVLGGQEITPEQKDVLMRAAARAADHAWLRPSRYLLIEGEGLAALGDVFAATEEHTANAARLERLKSMPKRAPLIIVAICQPVTHAKVPEVEQHLSTGAGVQNILNAAWALGLGAIWRTGELAYHPVVKHALGLSEDELLLGFVYVGHIQGAIKSVPDISDSSFWQAWEG